MLLHGELHENQEEYRGNDSCYLMEEAGLNEIGIDISLHALANEIHKKQNHKLRDITYTP